MTFLEMLENRQRRVKSLLCVGLDPSIDMIPKSVLHNENSLFEFNRAIIDSTSRYVCSYKPQVAYYSAIGAESQLEMTIDYIREEYSDIPIILDAKRNDVGSTAQMYAKEACPVPSK